MEAGSVGAWDYDRKTGKEVWFGKAHAQLGTNQMTPLAGIRNFGIACRRKTANVWSRYYK